MNPIGLQSRVKSIPEEAHQLCITGSMFLSQVLPQCGITEAVFLQKDRLYSTRVQTESTQMLKTLF